jgi:hypothetical protein
MVRQCPYGVAGDVLWVRETFCVGYEYEPSKFTAMPFDGCENTRKAFYRATDDDAPDEPKRPWKPSIHMPRWASRITLEIVNVRVERLQDISVSDIAAEGVTIEHDDGQPGHAIGHVDTPDGRRYTTATGCFIYLWNKINAARGYGWDVNPWVWVIEFKRVTP